MAAPVPTGNRFFTITEDDQRGAIWVVSIICCVYVLMILILRTTARTGGFGPDDYLAGASTATGLLQYIMIFVATSHGLGKAYADISPSEAESIGKDIFAANIFFLLTLFLAKVTVIYLCRRVFSSNMKSRIYLCDLTAGICAVWCLAAILAVSVDCPPLQQIGFRTSLCKNMVTRWKVIEIVDAATEAFLIGLSVMMVWPLQTVWYRKAVIVLYFVPRLILVVFIARHITTLGEVRDTPTRRNIFFTQSEIYMQVQLLYAILSAAIPAVFKQMRAFNTSMGSTWTTTSYGSGIMSGKKSSRLGSNAIKMNTITTSTNLSQISKRGRGRAEGIDSTEDAFRPDPINYSASASGRAVDADTQSHESIDSQSKIIRKETHWQVHREDKDVTGNQLSGSWLS